MDRASIGFRPDPVLARCKNTLRIQSILDCLVESHENIVIPVISSGDLIHERKVGPILSPAVFCAVGNKKLDEVVGSALRTFVFAVKHNTDNVIYPKWEVSIMDWKTKHDLEAYASLAFRW